jgi:hypothetical protein
MGHDLRQIVWASRRTALVRVLRQTGAGIGLSEHLDGDGGVMFRYTCAMGLEGNRIETAESDVSVAGVPIGSR